MVDNVIAFGSPGKVPRERVLKSGKIFAGVGKAAVFCVVVECSSGGCALRVTDAAALPDLFDFQMVGDELQACQVIWRATRELGVIFV